MTDLGNSLKQKAVLGALGPAMAMVESWTKDIHAQNEIAGFIEGNLGILFSVPPGAEQVEGITPLLVKLMTAEANERPEFAEQKLLVFYEAFRIFYRDLAAARAAAAASGSLEEDKHAPVP